MRIRLLGQRNVLGGGIHFSEFSDALKQVSYVRDLVDEIDISSSDWLAQSSLQFAEDDINIWFYPTDVAARLNGHHVCWAIFESDRLPDWYRDFMLHIPELVWSPSAWGQAVLTEHGIPLDRIDVVPEGVNIRLFHPFSRAKRVMPLSRRFRLLMIGKLEDRKGYSELFEALASLARESVDVELIVKGDYFLRHAEKSNELRSLIRRWDLESCVRVVEGFWRPEEMIALYNHADAFVFPSKAEGWGLPLIEALAAGLPALSTECTGHQHYLRDIDGLFGRIETSRQLITDPEYFSFWSNAETLGGCWNRPSVSSLKSAIMSLLSNYPARSQAALQASQLIRRNFSWENSVSRGLQSLQARGWLSLAVDLCESS